MNTNFVPPRKAEALATCKSLCREYDLEFTVRLLSGGELTMPYSMVRQNALAEMHLTGRHGIAELARTFNMPTGTVRHAIGRVLLSRGVVDDVQSRVYMAARKATIEQILADDRWVLRMEELVKITRTTAIKVCEEFRIPIESLYNRNVRSRGVIAARHRVAFILSNEYSVPQRKIAAALGMSEDQVIYGVGKTYHLMGDIENKFARLYRSRVAKGKVMRQNRLNNRRGFMARRSLHENS